MNPKFRRSPQPLIYPRQAIRRKQEGTVLIRAKISPMGNLSNLYVHQSSTFDLLDRTAIAAVKHWQFVPAKRNGKTVESWVYVPVNFVLTK